MTTTRKFPRAKVSRHKTLDGWVIDLLLKANAKPMRVNATYASIAWAHKAAIQKLGVKTGTPAPASPLAVKRLITAAEVPSHDRLDEVALTRLTAPLPTKGTCNRCHRPMRPAGSKAADYPGTTLRQREGLCQSCHQSSKRLAP